MNTDTHGTEIPNSILSLAGTQCECGSRDFELKNYSLGAHTGDVHCAACGKFIRVFDAG